MFIKSTNFSFAFTSVFILQIFLFATGCEFIDDDVEITENNSINEIVNGTETNYTTWKGVVALYWSSGYGGNICTATLIDPQVLLTAGHCVYLPSEGINAVSNPGNMSVFGGPDISGYNKVSYPGVAQVIKHSDWNGNINDQNAVDLALIKLTSPITTVETYGVRQAPAVTVNTTGTIVGYGLASSNQPNSSGVHRMGNTTVLNLYQRVMELGNPSGTCQGDSGGPFFTQQGGKWVVTGVTSYGTYSTCQANGGGWDVNVLTYRSWIDQTMQQLVNHGLDSDTENIDSSKNPCSGNTIWRCDPLTNEGCSGSDAACDYGVDQEQTQGFYCFEDSTESTSSACDPQNGPWCASGNSCYENSCRKYCCNDSQCPSGHSCQTPSPYWSEVEGEELGLCLSSGTGEGEGEGEDEGGGEGEGEGGGEGEGEEEGNNSNMPQSSDSGCGCRVSGSGKDLKPNLTQVFSVLF